ncbi:MAG: hypothetical protein K2O41_05675, partial [Clostridia bacterium]|nr:hypothetical protein [Clostridia bacterium]
SSGLCGTDSMPNTAIKYVSTDGGGYHSTTAPKKKGTFKATPVITDTNSNYSLKSTPENVTYTITAINVAKPALPSTTIAPYDGTQRSLTLSGYTHDGAGANIVSVTAKSPSGKTLTVPSPAFDATTGTIYFKEAGTYTIAIALEDSTNCVWSDGSGTGRFEIPFTVQPKSLSISVSNDNVGGQWTWSVGTEVKTTVTASDIVTGDTVKLTTVYTPSTGASVKSDGTSISNATQVSDVLTLPDSLMKGNYTLTAEIDNENYSIADGLTAAGMPLTFNVEPAVFDPDTFVWTYTKNNTGSNAIADGDSIIYEVDATGAAYTYKLSINFGTFTSAFYTLNDSDYTNRTQSSAGSYTTKVKLTIKSNDYAFDTTKTYQHTTVSSPTVAEVTINWTIEQKEVDLSNVAFEYTTDNGASWTTYNPSNPPEANGYDPFEVRIAPSVTANSGITGIVGATAQNYNNQFGPGRIDFYFNFQLDSNYKAMSGQNQSSMPYHLDTTGEKITVEWSRVPLLDASGNPIADSEGVPYYVWELENIPSHVLPYLQYTYYEVDTANNTWGSQITGTPIGKHEALDYIISANGKNANSQNPVTVYVRAELVNVPQTNNVPQFVLDFTAAQPEYQMITIGDNKRAVELTAGTLTSMTYGQTINIADAYVLTDKKLNQPMPDGRYKVSLYDGANEIAPDVTGYDFAQLPAGNYTLKFTLVAPADSTHVLAKTTLPFKVKPVELTVPTLKDGVTLTFNGEEQDLKDSLQNFDERYMKFADNCFSTRYHAGTYQAIIVIKDEYKDNYVFVLPTANATAKMTVKGFADGEVNLPQLSDNDTTAILDWTINKYVYDTTAKNAWDFTKDGASLSFNGVPASIKALTMGSEPTLKFEVVYYDLKGNPLTEYELKGGSKFLVAAYLVAKDDETGYEYADADDIVFKNQTTDVMTGLVTSPQTTYTVPQGGAAAFFGKTLDFVKSNWLWFVIALAALIFLIILIVIIAKRRKNKEAREEKKAKKEEEKERREEEKRRREEEREAAKERQKQELELAKAKQEAELAKIKAQAMAGIGAAGVAMAAQPQQAQQPVQQPAPQAVPVQQPQYAQAQQPMPQPTAQPYYAPQGGDLNAVMAKLETEFAKLRAEHAMSAYQQHPQYPQFPQYPQAPSQNGAGGLDIGTYMLMRLESDIQQLRSERGNNNNNNGQPVYMPLQSALAATQPPMAALPQSAQQSAQNDTAAITAAAVAAAVAAVTAQQKPEKEVRTVETETTKSVTVDTPTAYPPDAVVTTTTTVDTTKKAQQPTTRARSRDDGKMFDIDGFYDAFDGK